MRLELRGHHVSVTPNLRRFVEDKLSKLERLLNHRAVSAQAILTVERHRHVTDLTLHASGEKLLHGLGDATNWETSLTQAVAKITHQAQRLKTRKKDKRHRLAPVAGAIAPLETRARTRKAEREEAAGRPKPRMPRVVRASRVTIKPMSVEDAAREVDAGGDGVVVFRDIASQAISVLYRRRNGELTLVDTEA